MAQANDSLTQSNESSHIVLDSVTKGVFLVALTLLLLIALLAIPVSVGYNASMQQVEQQLTQTAVHK